MNQAQAWLCARDLVQSQMGNDEQGRPHSCVLTDFKVRDSGFERVLVIAGAGVSPTRAGRIVQRLLELETYRLMVLRGLPVAKQLAPQLTRMETAWPTMPSAWSTKPPKTNNCWTPWCLWRYGWKKPRPSTCTVLARRGPTRPSLLCSAWLRCQSESRAPAPCCARGWTLRPKCRTNSCRRNSRGGRICNCACKARWKACRSRRSATTW